MEEEAEPAVEEVVEVEAEVVLEPDRNSKLLSKSIDLMVNNPVNKESSLLEERMTCL